MRPLTERILERLPGSRALWIAAWALVPWANAGANVLLDTGGTSAVWEQRTALVVLNYAALSFAVAFAVWGAGRIARRLELLPATTAGKVLADDLTDAFRALNGLAVPLVATVVTAVGFGVSAHIRDGWSAALLRGGTWLLIGIPLWTFLWTYASLQLGLDRLGRQPLPARAAHVDPSMGLRPLGDVAFTGLWMLLAWLVPAVVTGVPDVVGLVLGVALLAAGVAAFFLSLSRLHRRMAALKQGELATARALYAEAYEPVRAEPTLESLERQRNLLSAADSLEGRARALHDWPIDDGTVARVLTIATSVVAISTARVILDPLGL